MHIANASGVQPSDRAALRSLYRAARERRGLSPKPMDGVQMAAALRAAAAGIESGDRYAFAKGLSDVLSELFAAREASQAMALVEPDKKI